MGGGVDDQPPLGPLHRRDGPWRRARSLELIPLGDHDGFRHGAMIIISASTLLRIAINLGKLALLSIAMAQPMITARCGGPDDRL